MSKIIVGIDEVGRGCWAGPLVVGAVILDTFIPGLTDSKMLSKVERQRLYVIIKQKAVFSATGWVWPEEIDQLGLTAATAVAIKRSIKTIPEYDQILIDGSFNYLKSNVKASTQIKADLHEPCVSAASILAKVERDTYMMQQNRLHPGYGFNTNVGYGTHVHKQGLASLGITNIHRKSYKPIQGYITNDYA